MEQDARASAPLITLFERDDSIAVPLLSQLRMAGYDVRSARTPVELFDILGKNLVTLVLVDLGAATAGRREFWVALDAQRRGRAMQVLTFRYLTPVSDLELDFEPSARAIADVEIHGAHEFQRVVDAVRQRAPLHGPPPSADISYTANGGIQPLGVALGLTPPPYSAQPGFGAYGAASAPSQQPGFAPEYAQGYPQGFAADQGYGYVGGGFGMTPPPAQQAHGMSGYSVPPGGFAPQGFMDSPSAPSMYGFGAPGQPGAAMETAPISESVFAQAGFGPGGFAGQPQPFGQPLPQPHGVQSSPFASPTAANPFSSDVITSPFAQPYVSNPFGSDASAPSNPVSPFTQGVGQSVNPFAQGFGSGPEAGRGSGYGAPSAHSGPSFPGLSQPSGPSMWGAGSGGYIASASGFSGWRTPDSGPDSFGSDPGAQHMFGATPSPMSGYSPLSAPPSAPAFQDVWTPPDGENEMETGALSEEAFRTSAEAWSAATSEPRHPTAEPQYSSTQQRPWDAPAHQPDFSASQQYRSVASDVYERSTAAVETPVSAVQTHSLGQRTSTPTETALGSVLVEGALLTPGKLETLRGIQAMLTDANMPRKLGELAVMFKFLSSDQLLAALLVSRGLVSPQQIASLGRLKQEMAAKGENNDLASLLIRFDMVAEDQLHTLRQELAS